MAGSIIIRRCNYTDSQQVRSLLVSSELQESVPIFKTIFLNEITLQALMIVSAVVFIFAGLPFKYCLLLLPVSGLVIFLSIYSRLYMRATQTLANLEDTISMMADSDNTGVWVAEVVGLDQMAQDTNRLHVCENVARETKPGIVALLAIQEKIDADMQEPPHTVGVIVKFTVEKKLRRKGIGSELFSVGWQMALNQYRALEILSPEHDHSSRMFLEKHDFSVLSEQEVSWLPAWVSLRHLRLRRACLRTLYEDDLQETLCQK